MFYVPSANTQVYKTGDPKSGKWVKAGTMGSYGDPDLFVDDDERLYMYYGLSNNAPTSVVELDPYTFNEIGSRATIVSAQASIHGWERRGDDNLLDESPWIEGSWMVKHDGKYYLCYSAPGTEFKTYADGVYVADSPLGPFEYADYSPFSFKPTGFIAGAGHGNTFKDKDGNYWHIGTMVISVQHSFERRLGLAPVSFDEDDHIFSNNIWGDYPQYFPGIKEDPANDNFAGMMLLSHKKYVMASTSLDGYNPENAVDEEVRTMWSAQTGGDDEWIMIDLGKECSVEAIQVNFGEHNTNPALVRGRDKEIYEQYILEQSTDGKSWSVLVDKSNNTEDVPHDYIELENPVTARYIKLKNVYTPGNGNFAVRDLRVFGNSDEAVFTTINDFTVERDMADGRDAVIRWTPVENADGYNVKYGIAPDKLYNSYMVYDADSVAMHSLNHGVDYYFSVIAFNSGTDYYQPTGEMRSHQSGDWNDVTTWEEFDGTSWVNPSSVSPSLSDKPVTILEGHTITVTENDSVQHLTIEAGGTLEINENILFYIKDRIETDLVVEGTLKNSGTLSGDAEMEISFNSGSTYQHNRDGGPVPQGNWRPNSTISITGILSELPEGMNQNFFNVVWNCPDQTTDLNFEWDEITIGGDITIENTGSSFLQMCNPTDGIQVDIEGDFIQTGGKFAITSGSNAATNIEINLFGDIEVSGGNLAICRNMMAGMGTVNWKVNGDVSLLNSMLQNSDSEGGKLVFANAGNIQKLSLSGITYSEKGVTAEVDSGVTLNIGESIFGGAGNFYLKAGAALMTANVNGINGSISNSGIKLFNKTSGYVFNGSSAQVTGSLLPDTVQNLMIINNNGVTLSNSVVVNGIMELQKGQLNLDNNTLSYGNNGTLKYSGTAGLTTSDAEFPVINGPSKLVIANSGDVLLHASRRINDLSLTTKLDLGTDTLMVSVISNIGQDAFLITTDGGFLSRTVSNNLPILFPVGTTVYSPAWVTNSGLADQISVGVVRDNDVSTSDGRVRLKWNIGEAIPGGGDYTLKFGWPRVTETSGFRNNREEYSKIYNLTEGVEAGDGAYVIQSTEEPYTVERGGITSLGAFGVGLFTGLTGIFYTPVFAQDGFDLLQNYPNPFNASTNIDFEIPEKSFVSLKVVNVLGEELIELAGKEYFPGIHSVTFNANDLTKGIYFYTIKAKDFARTRKMILQK